MKIVFTGGGTGGHFFPIIAVAEEIIEIADREKIIETRLYYFSDSPYDERALYTNNIKFEKIPSEKLRRYFSISNFFAIFQVGMGVIVALRKLYGIFPDVVFGKGGYASFPTLLAARILGIPVVIHESDAYPGRVNKWAGKFAKRIAISFDEAATYFPKGRTALTGQPVRKEIMVPASAAGAFEYLKLNSSIPVVLILGGSQGATLINDILLDALPRLIENYQIIHQAGTKNIQDVQGRSAVILDGNKFKDRYRPYGFMNSLTMKNAAGVSSVVVTRGGGTIFEIALWQKPAIVIPISNSNGDHQRRNAYGYARTGAALVIDESNLTPTILQAEIEKIMTNPAKQTEMSKAAGLYSKPQAAATIAKEIIAIALSHES